MPEVTKTIEIVVATTNLHKLQELRKMLRHLSHIELLSLRSYPDYEPLPEDGDSLQEIASQKALHAANKLNAWALADDSGLFVPALNGLPGVRSARYAGEDSSDAKNRAKLIRAMSGLEGVSRTAYFECALAFAKPGRLIRCVTGRCEGIILNEQRGGKGFGYDPLFLKNHYDKTFAELDGDIKNRISHRGRAIEKMGMVLEASRP